MEIPVEKITDEQAANVLGAVAAATIPDPPKKKSCIIRTPEQIGEHGHQCARG